LAYSPPGYCSDNKRIPHGSRGRSSEGPGCSRESRNTRVERHRAAARPVRCGITHGLGAAGPPFASTHALRTASSRWLSIRTTEHPALIPQEAAGSSRRYPRIPATARPKGPLTTGTPAYPRSARKRHDRPVTPEVAGSSPVAPVKLPANRHVLLSPRAQSTAGFLDPVYIPHGSAVPSGPDRSSAATTLVRSRTHPASPFPVVAPQQCETSSADRMRSGRGKSGFGCARLRRPNRSMASSQLRRAETREYGQDPPVGILFSLSGMLSFVPAAASLAQRDGAPVPAPGAAPAPTEPEQLGLFRNRG
jgi:hypothetical protein